MQYCIFCGEEIPQDETQRSNFCENCGRPLSQSLSTQAVVPPIAPTADTAPTDVSGNEPAPSRKKGKGKKALVLCAILILAAAVAGTGIFLALQAANGSTQQLQQALQAGDYEAIAGILKDPDAKLDQAELEKQLFARVEQIKADYMNQTIEYSAALQELDQIRLLELAAPSAKANELRSLIIAVNSSRTSFTTAESLFAREEYAAAIGSYLLVIPDDPNYEAAKTRLAECKNSIRQKALADAAMYAQAKEYGQAISVLNAALEVLPQDTDLSVQISLYTQDQKKYEKEAILAEAAAYAQQKDYVSAIHVLTAAMNSMGTDSALSGAYTTYCNQYASAVLTEAAEAAAEDPMAAVAIIQKAQRLLPDNKKLQSAKAGYEADYADSVLENVQKLVADKQYTQAIAELTSALKKLPGNSALTAQRDYVQTLLPKNFMDVCKPYQYGGYTEYTNGQSFLMGGESYTNGFALTNCYSDTFILSNFGGKYSYLEFDLGHIDGTSMREITIDIYLDGNFYQSITVDPYALPKHIVLDIGGCQQIKITASGGHIGGPHIGFANMLLYTEPAEA